MPGRLKIFLNRVLRHKVKLAVILLILCLYWFWLPPQLFSTRASTILVDRNNCLLAAQIAPDGQWRFPIEDSIPYKFETCILTFEDEYFYYHPGINPFSLCKSLARNLNSGRIKSGGSTLTM